MSQTDRTKGFDALLLALLFFAIACYVAIMLVSPPSNPEKQLRQDLKEACTELDRMGFDGDPWMCLDPDGDAYNN